MEEPRWTLDELAERVDAALAVDYHGQSSGRVRDVPDRRAIRWYTTIGLIDRPVAHRGRIALYGPRHLLQLVAVKRLQAKGLPLVAIQRELAGAPDTELGRVARLPATALAQPEAAPVRRVAGGSPSAGATPPLGSEATGALDAGAGPSATKVPGGPTAAPAAGAAARRLAAGPARRAAFWRQPPAAALTAEAAGAADATAEVVASTEPAGTVDTVVGAAATPTGPAAPVLPAAGVAALRGIGVAALRGIRLGAGATLLLEPGRDLDAADVRAILDAAEPLLAVLRARGLAGMPDPSARPGADGEPRREHP
jgi:hypothetical protein